MGQIKSDVKVNHLQYHLGEEDYLRPFLNDFSITWGRERKINNTVLSVYFLKPEKSISDLFGIEDEILLAITQFPTLQPRTMQAIEAVMGESPARGRVDQSVFLLISPASNLKQWIDEYTSKIPESRIPIPFSMQDIENARKDAWVIRNIIGKTLYYKNLFADQLPVKNDRYFFGREGIVAEFLDAIRSSQNRGLFGLRKTGKTSLLYKLNRLSKEQDGIQIILYDCKLPSIRELNYKQFLEKIVEDTRLHFKNIGRVDSSDHISNQFVKRMKLLPAKSRLSLVFDEIEYISPISTVDPHWKRDFMPFWQTLWSAQSEARNVSYIIAGVNPTVVETDLFSGVQNPMFGIFSNTYLRGFDIEDLKNLIKIFGRRMGLIFTEESIKYIFERYGGHPLLSRMACSFVHVEEAQKNADRPIEITKEYLHGQEKECDNEILYYCRHIVSELREFYPDEYEMLELLASDNVIDFQELSRIDEWIRHLRAYGLLEIPDVGRPIFAIPAVGEYIARERKRRRRQPLFRDIVSKEIRSSWRTRRVEAILSDVRDLDQLLSDSGKHDLYGGQGIPESERFYTVLVVEDRNSFSSFINTMYRCFVEGAQKHLKKKQGVDLWTYLQSDFPDLEQSLTRIKLYRHNQMHLELRDKIEEECLIFLKEDLEGKSVEEIEGGYFVLQQTILDNLMIDLQCELARVI